ncbi:flavin reductase family protein [Ramlibacter henchirensis]|uniref:Flavin reductase family protein n=1 Tax=Ramlibacter henchirensis TaxID=204072 RepID=A0A4Z0C399_9BURK|nr:flavin reductase family protein [Ramlibacter henchirensis]TFZ06147.1 flavin reductase family protein [Ramlibacter henchirensis]
MRILASDMDPQQTYKLLTGIIVPRPIAWVCTRSEAGVLNIAPFSAFTFVSNKPPMIGVNIGRKAGVMKDTGNNILSRREYVVHIADEALLHPLHESAEEHPPEVSEVELLGLDTIASDFIDVPRLAAPPVAMECRLHQSIAFGATGSEFMVGEVLAFHIREGLARDFKIDTLALNPVCRLGGPNYATLGRIVTLRAVSQTGKTIIEG